MGLTRRIADAMAHRAMNVDQLGVYGGGMSLSTPYSEFFLDDDETRWSASATAYRCVQAIASNAASLPVQVRSTVDDTTLDNHWLPPVWERPNPLWSRKAQGEWAWTNLETRGQTFIYLNRGASGEGRVQEMWPIFGRVEPVIAGIKDDSAQGIREVLVGFKVTLRNGKRLGLLPSEVLWLRYPHPDIAWWCLSPLQAAGHAVEVDAYARSWQRNEFRHGGQPKHVIYLGEMSQAAYDKAVESWRSQVAGPENAGKSLLLSSPQPSKVERLTANAQEMGYLDSRGVNAQEIMLAFGVPKDYLLGGATYENRAASRSTLWTDTIIPKLETVAGEGTRQLLAAEPGRRMRFDTDDVDALQESGDKKTERVVNLTGVDVFTIDEARAEVGQEPLPNGVGALTITAYRTLIATEAQAALLDGRQVADRNALLRLVTAAPGRAGSNIPSAPLLLPSNSRMHGPPLDTILAEYDRHERVMVKAVGRLAARQQAVTLTNVSRVVGGNTKKGSAWMRDFNAAWLAWQAGIDGDDADQLREQVRAKIDKLFDRKHWYTETADAMAPSVGGAWEAGGVQLARSLGIDFDKFEQIVAEQMEVRVDVLAHQVTDTTADVLESQVLIDGVAAGESIDQLKARIRGVFATLKGSRATMIARTETVGGFNAGSYLIAEGSGVVSEREWGATDDSRVRDTHRRQDGYRVKGFNARYPNGCLHPGDPTAKPEETIQCRCVEFYWTED